MHYPVTDIQADFESIGLLDFKLPREEIISTDDRRTEGQADGQTSRTATIGSFFFEKRNYYKLLVT